MPTSDYADCKVAEIYEQLDDILKDSRKSNRIAIVAGDWNAEIGEKIVGEAHAAIGQHGMGSRNARGEWLASWASTS
eukprot:4986952-Karenia_brevis.AAC.1